MISIAFIDTLGLTYDGNTLKKRGLGGSESAVILMSKELVKLGFSVTVFNDCESDDSFAGSYDGVEYIPIRLLKEGFPYSYDVVISSRSVLPFINFKNITWKYSILWMHDTFCQADDLIQDLVLDGTISKIFTLSDFHTSYVTNCEHGRKRMFEVLKKFIFQTRNGIVLYDNESFKYKDPNLFVYNASVTKGMLPLVTEVWPRVKKLIPDAKLKVIGGYYRFRSDSEPDEQENSWRRLVAEYSNLPLDIEFTGIIKQSEIAKILSNASYTIYPTAFPETFGISTLESIAYNTPIISCDFGAMEETAFETVSYKIPFPIEPNGLFPYIDKQKQIDSFVNLVVKAHQDKYLWKQKAYACNSVKDICTWDTVALQWKQHIYKALGKYLPVEEYRKVDKINTKVHRLFGRRFVNLEELKEPKNQPFNKICVITPVYNAEAYIGKCIESVATQNYSNWEMWIIDDKSSDNTVKVAEETIAKFPSIDGKINIIKNEENKGALYNQVTTIMDKVGDDIVMLLDGDDWLINDPSIFDKYNNLYNEGAEFTYGSCWSLVDNIPLIAQPYPKEIIESKKFREHRFNWNMPYTHLRTFKGYLLHSFIFVKGYWPFKDENGNWLKAGGDTALFYAMIEEANNIVCVPDVVYVYNDCNPLNDYKVNGEEQTRTANNVINRTKKILIAIPCKNDIEADTFKSIYDLEVPPGYETQFHYFYGYAVDQVRNLIAHRAIQWGFDYVFWVDHDITFRPDTLKKLLSHDKDIVCGVYRQRLLDVNLEIYDQNLKRYPNIPVHNSLIEIGGCGFGCALTTVDILKRVGYPQFIYHHAIEFSDTISEDLDFCSKARIIGGRIWCDTSILCGHIGSTSFDIAEFNPTNRLEELSNQDLLPKEHFDYLNSIKSIEPKVIYDIGSCVLHWTKKARMVWPDARIVAFEAMDAVKDLYIKEGIEYCIGHPLFNTDYEDIVFHENVEHPGGNSIFTENPEFSPLARELFHGRGIVRSTRRLDTLVKDLNIPLPDLIKIDAQGAELQILQGADETLKNCKDIILELQHVDYNIGAAKYEEVKNYLETIGFKEVCKITGSSLGVDADYHFTKA